MNIEEKRKSKDSGMKIFRRIWGEALQVLDFFLMMMEMMLLIALEQRGMLRETLALNLKIL